mmetsp:Transcript_74360/g.193228  ORF Transcript_74360/g.193228 Transcript_74360/m.193228 type:complete len:359 (-) Transcript_74360:146-1222(-)
MEPAIATTAVAVPASARLRLQAQGLRVQGLHCRRCEAEVCAELRGEIIEARIALARAESETLGPGKCQDIADMHQREDDLRGILERFVGRKRCTDLLEGAAPPSVDHRDPIRRRIRQDCLALPANMDSLHRLWRQGLEREQERLVEFLDASLRSPEAAHGQGTPIPKPKYRRRALWCQLQAPEHIQDHTELEILTRHGCEHGEHRRGVQAAKPQSRQGRRSRKILLLPLTHFAKQLLGCGVVLEVLPHGLQQGVYLFDEPVLQQLLGDRARHERLFDVLELGVDLAACTEGVALPGEQDVLQVVQARIHEVIPDEMHLLVVGSRHRLFGHSRAVGVPDFPLNVLRCVFHENRAVGIRL